MSADAQLREASLALRAAGLGARVTRTHAPTRPADPPYTRGSHVGALQVAEARLAALRAVDEARTGEVERLGKLVEDDDGFLDATIDDVATLARILRRKLTLRWQR